MIILDFLKYLKGLTDLHRYHDGLLRPRNPMLASSDLINQNSLRNTLVCVTEIAAIEAFIALFGSNLSLNEEKIKDKWIFSNEFFFILTFLQRNIPKSKSGWITVRC